MVPSYIRKVISGPGNNWCKVASHKTYESNVGNRGSKSTWVEKEQRVYGSWHDHNKTCLICTLMGNESTYQVKILSKQIINKRLYSSVVERSLSNKYSLNPWFLTGFIDVLKIIKLSHANCYTVLASVKKENQIIKSKLDRTANTALVIWGSNLRSSVGSGRITKVERNMIKLAPYQKSVIIGLLLSDGWLSIASKASKNARLWFKQSLDKSTYVFHVFNILSHYCSNVPIWRLVSEREKSYTVYSFLLDHLLVLPGPGVLSSRD